VAETVLDASAILADLNGEPGADRVAAAVARGSAVSAINLAEVVSKLIVRGMEQEQAVLAATRFDAEVVEIDRNRAASAGILHAGTRDAGLSLADAFCLSLAAELRLPALTTDRAWRTVGGGIEVRLIR
jgi:ribonuclease VapC